MHFSAKLCITKWPTFGFSHTTWGSVNARKPRSCNNRLPAGKGYGVASAMRLSWRRPPQVSLRKRMMSRALTNKTFFTVWSFFLPLELFLNKIKQGSKAQHKCQRHHPQSQLCDCGRHAPKCCSVSCHQWHARQRCGLDSKLYLQPFVH